MPAPEDPGVRTHREDDVLHVTLDRPATLNALRPADVRALGAAMALEPGVRAVVFRGAGDRSFTAGMHVDSFEGLTRGTAQTFISGLRATLAAVRTAPVVTIAAVHGYCIGAGFELALACDLRVATTSASFGLPEIKVGIPSVVDAALLPGYVGASLAQEMILTGDLYPVGRFAASGLCNEVVEPDRLDTAVQGWLARTARHTATVTAAQKRLFEVWRNVPLSTATELSTREFAGLVDAEETREQLARYRKGL
jgi:enoyl-CoA hydratase